MSRWLGLGARSPPQAKVDDNDHVPVDFVSDNVGSNIALAGRLPCRRKSSEVTIAISDSSRRESMQQAQDVGDGTEERAATTTQSSSCAGHAVTPDGVARRLGSTTAASHGRSHVGGVGGFTFVSDNEEDDDAEWEEIATPTDSAITSPGVSSPPQQCRLDHLERERPLSPGVDFSIVLPKPGASASFLPREDDMEDHAEVAAAVGTEHDGDRSGTPGGDRRKWVDARNNHSFLVRGPTYLTVRTGFMICCK